jgi:hypothetical protein
MGILSWAPIFNGMFTTHNNPDAMLVTLTIAGIVVILVATLLRPPE